MSNKFIGCGKVITPTEPGKKPFCKLEINSTRLAAMAAECSHSKPGKVDEYIFINLTRKPEDQYGNIYNVILQERHEQ